MANDKEYNGWHNYETWAVKLWMDNEESSYNYWQGQVRDGWESIAADYEPEDRSVQARITIADQLKYEHEAGAPELTGIYSDLLGAALSEVDWFEIADALLTDAELDGYEPRK